MREFRRGCFRLFRQFIKGSTSQTFRDLKKKIKKRYLKLIDWLCLNMNLSLKLWVFLQFMKYRVFWTNNTLITCFDNCLLKCVPWVNLKIRPNFCKWIYDMLLFLMKWRWEFCSAVQYVFLIKIGNLSLFDVTAYTIGHISWCMHAYIT